MNWLDSIIEIKHPTEDEILLQTLEEYKLPNKKKDLRKLIKRIFLDEGHDDLQIKKEIRQGVKKGTFIVKRKGLIVEYSNDDNGCDDSKMSYAGGETLSIYDESNLRRKNGKPSHIFRIIKDGVLREKFMWSNNSHVDFEEYGSFNEFYQYIENSIGDVPDSVEIEKKILYKKWCINEGDCRLYNKPCVLADGLFHVKDIKLFKKNGYSNESEHKSEDYIQFVFHNSAINPLTGYFFPSCIEMSLEKIYDYEYCINGKSTYTCHHKFDYIRYDQYNKFVNVYYDLLDDSTTIKNKDNIYNELNKYLPVGAGDIVYNYMTNYATYTKLICVICVKEIFHNEIKVKLNCDHFIHKECLGDKKIDDFYHEKVDDGYIFEL